MDNFYYLSISYITIKIFNMSNVNNIHQTPVTLFF